MKLFKRRPALVFAIDPVATPGTQLRGTLIIKAEEPIDIDWLKVIFEGHEFCAVGDGKQRDTETTETINQELQLLDSQTLAKGTHRLEFRFALPNDLSPSYEHSDARTRYRLRARASIPRWPDARAKHLVKVRSSKPAREHPGRPLLCSTRASGPRGTEAYAELSLAHSVFALGDRVFGAIAVGNVEHNRYRAVLLELILIQKTFIKDRQGTNSIRKYRQRIELSRAKENQKIPFVFSVPTDLPVTFDATRFSHSWNLRARIDLAWAIDPKLDHPVTIVERRFRSSPGSLPVPVVGNERIDGFWDSIASFRDLELIGSSLRGVYGETTLLVWQETTTSTSALHATIAFPNLGLDLEIAPTGAFFGRGKRGFQFGHDSWDRRHRVSMRSDNQASSFLNAIRTGLTAQLKVRMDDRSLSVSKTGVGSRPEELSQFIDPLIELCQRIEPARQTIGPVDHVVPHIAGWRQLAEQLGGTLNLGDISIIGRFHNHPVALRSLWLNQLPSQLESSLELRVRLDPSLNCHFDWSLSTGSEPLSDALIPEEMPLAARAAIRKIETFATRLDIGGDQISVTTPWPKEARTALGTLSAISNLADSLAANALPYR